MIKVRIKGTDEVIELEDGLSPEDIKKAMVERRQAQPAPDLQTEVDERTRPDLSKEVRDTAKENLGTPFKPFLDFIAKYESGPHGYNQLNGINNHANITEMSIAQLQEGQRNGTIRGTNSSAAGRYQFMPNTLDTAMRLAGISSDTIMTPDVQDRLAIALLEHRGLSRFLHGTLDEEGFMENLSKEWAALPKLDGKGYHDGVAGNKAHAPVEGVLEQLDLLRSEGAVYSDLPNKRGAIIRDVMARMPLNGDETYGYIDEDTNEGQEVLSERQALSKVEESLQSPDLGSYESGIDNEMEQIVSSSADKSTAPKGRRVSTPTPTNRYKRSAASTEATAQALSSTKADLSALSLHNPDQESPLLGGTPHVTSPMGQI
jgi:muramidase (phage lysozyme)